MTDVTDVGTPLYDSTIANRGSQTELDEWNSPENDDVDGYDLLKDEALYELVGVPFRATKVIFRDGIQRKDMPYQDDYVSIEVQVPPIEGWDVSRTLARRRTMKLPDGSPTAKPGDLLVINDGSTGIYRQVVEYLYAKGLITLPEGEMEGEKGESVLDLPRSQWVDGADAATTGISIRLKCKRGLRFSDYKNSYTGDNEARTWYLA